MHIGQVLDTVFDDYVGWRPASGALKPVHVANGLLRSLCGESADVQRLHEFLVWWQKGKVPDDARTFEALMAADAEGVYAGFKDHPTQLFEQTRTYALGLLGGDHALFPTRDSSSFSLTCKQMITRDYNDRHIGDFIAQVILGETDLAGIIRGYADVTRPQDPITALAWPLLRGQPRKVEGARRQRIKQPRVHQEYTTQMRAAAECLATHERRQGNHLRALQRVVQFGAVAVLAHAQALAAGGRLDRRTPLLVAMSASRQSDIAMASERSLDLTVRAFERWLGDKLSERIAAGEPLAPEENPLPASSTNLKSVRAILAKIGVAEKGHAEPSDELIEGRIDGSLRSASRPPTCSRTPSSTATAARTSRAALTPSSSDSRARSGWPTRTSRAPPGTSASGRRCSCSTCSSAPASPRVTRSRSTCSSSASGSASGSSSAGAAARSTTTARPWSARGSPWTTRTWSATRRRWSTSSPRWGSRAGTPTPLHL